MSNLVWRVLDVFIEFMGVCMLFVSVLEIDAF